MAKCIRKDDQIRRVSDEKAAKLVKEGWHLTSKGAWKSAGRPALEKDGDDV